MVLKAPSSPYFCCTAPAAPTQITSRKSVLYALPPIELTHWWFQTMNQVVLWDSIVMRSERVILDERRLQSKYYFLDDGTNLLNHPNVTLVLRYVS